MKSYLILLMVMFAASAFAEGKKVAVVKIMRGDVELSTSGKTTKLKVDDWVESGAVVKTAEKSFVKLIFIDKSQINVGPNSEMKIEKFIDNDSGVIDLVKGKIRSQVTKDYLQMNDKDKSKLFIKTPNAVMGIRGTDFMISTNGKNTAAVLFEGSVVFNRIEAAGVSSTGKLEDIVNEGVRLYPGEFSVVDQYHVQPTIPSRLNIQQRESLEKNDTFDSRAPSASTEEVKKSVVPNGLTGKMVANDSATLRNEVGQAPAPATNGTLADANGYVKGDAIKPANGSFVHIESGIIIPPGSDSVLDPNTNTYIPGPQTGRVAADGSYIPPAGTEINSDGQIMTTVRGADGKLIVVVTEPPPVVKTDAPNSGTATTAPGTAPTATATGTAYPNLLPPKDISGGVPDVGTAVQQFNNAPRVRTINVNNR